MVSHPPVPLLLYGRCSQGAVDTVMVVALFEVVAVVYIFKVFIFAILETMIHVEPMIL